MSGQKAKRHRRLQIKAATRAEMRAVTNYVTDMVTARYEAEVWKARELEGNYHKALGDVRSYLFGLEILTVANGGDETARAFGTVADKLSGSINTLQRASQALMSAGISYLTFDHAPLILLVQLCAAMKNAANHYATADARRRPMFQRKIADAIAEANPIIAELVNNRTTNARTERRKMFAQIIRGLQQTHGTYREAIKSLKQIHPDLAREFLPVTGIAEDEENYCRVLIHEML